MKASGSETDMTRFSIDRCISCDAKLEIENQTLFCTEFCKQVAQFVRYARGVIRDPSRANDPEVSEAMRIRMAILLGGGYPERARRLNVAQRTAIIERDGGRCRRCGEPANEIDHIAGSSSDPSNLQLLCDRCHNDKTKSTFVPANEEQRAWAQELWDTRIFAEQPLRLCDDETKWKQEWRTLKIQRTDQLWKRLEEETGRKRAEYQGMRWEDALNDAYDSNILPGEGFHDASEDIDP
jgi:5-methylcytosine-specific restriction endonuclease McrA